MRRAFPDGGYYILGTDFETPREIRIVADAGPLGYREIAAHGHADALSFTLSAGGTEMLVDPGTFAYHTQPEWRAYFRGTAAHNTVRIDGRDQSQPGGNFMWLRKAQAHCTSWISAVDEDELVAWHDGYRFAPDPVVHRRRLTLDKRLRTLQVADTLEMEGSHRVEIFFHCAEGSVVEPRYGGFDVSRGARRLRIRWPEARGGAAEVLIGSTQPIGGWISRRFDRKEPAPTLVWSAPLAGRQILRTVIEIGE
jgi:hypothetical protein